MRNLVGASVSDFRRCWKNLFLTAVYYQLIAFILLTPTVSILFRIFVATSGETLLADQDILFFFMAPLGWVCLITGCLVAGHYGTSIVGDGGGHRRQNSAWHATRSSDSICGFQGLANHQLWVLSWHLPQVFS